MHNTIIRPNATNPNALHVAPLDELGYVTYASTVTRDILAIKELVAKGHKIVWNMNDRFCTVNGQTFNIHKNVWLLRSR